MPVVAPYGSWRSPVDGDRVVAGSLRFGQPEITGEAVLWTELRPDEDGRYALVEDRAGSRRDLLAPPWNVRSRVHEYGGGAFTVGDGTVLFSHDGDRRLYRLDSLAPITPEGPWRYADGRVMGDRLVCVREDHAGDGEPVNQLVAIPLRGGPAEVVATGRDFYSSPRPGPDGRLAWLCWDHPHMPWDSTELHLREADGTDRLIAGGPDESVFQPGWDANGDLVFVSDWGGWWNLYAWDGRRVRPLCPLAAEFGLPQWVFGMSTWAPLPDGRLLAACTRDGAWQLGIVADGAFAPFDLPYTDIGDLRCDGRRAVFIGAAPARLPELVELDLATRACRTIRHSDQPELPAACLSVPEAISFPTADGATAHGFFYPPKNDQYRAPNGERPPLIVKIHGGPTAATNSALSLKTQYWTSRGFAVLDVNYRGSTGHGRDYHRQLYGNWGVADVDDCVHGARFLADRGNVDPDRLAITGGSAGGYTVLAALTFRDCFHVGASYYGVSDCELLARDTHKFESRYLDILIAPYPERRDVYRERSPIHHVERLNCPVIFLHGLEDRVVPPNQAERMAAALREKHVPVAHITFPDEQHGFRKGPNIRRALQAELDFYRQIMGIVEDKG